MLRFVVRRLLLLVPILLGLSILVFAWIRALPGGPAEALLGERATPERSQQIERAVRSRRAGLRPVLALPEDASAQGDLGTSIRRAGRSPTSSGSASPRRSSSRSGRCSSRSSSASRSASSPRRSTGASFDHASLLISLLGISIPIFFLAILLKYVFAVKLGLAARPSAGMSVLIDIQHPTNFYILDAIIAGNPEALGDAIKHLILPAIALGLDPARDHRAHHARVGARRPERGLRAHGARQGLVAAHRRRRHILRNALLPIVDVIGLQTGLLLSGAVLTETVFALARDRHVARRRDRGPRLPGAPGRDPLHRGRLRAREPVVDLSYALINPRIRVLVMRRRARSQRARARRAERPLARRVAAAAAQPGRDRRLRRWSGSSCSSRVFAP